MHTWTKRLLAVPLMFTLAAPPLWAADSCPGGCPIPPANSHFVSTPGPVPVPPAPAAFLVATLKKGKKKRVVAVEAVVTTSIFAPAAPTSLSMFGDVNGILMEPTGSPLGITEDCYGFVPGAPPPPGSCTVSGTFWLDIDANPALINVPLTVTLFVGEFGVPTGVPVIASMSVRLEKK
jgi:hypothetical protein